MSDAKGPGKESSSQGDSAPRMASAVDSFDENNTSRLGRKFKENPFFPIGIAGFTVAAIYGLAGIRKRGDMPLSLYLIHLRVGAQGVVVGTLTIGVTYTLGKRLYNLYYGIEPERNPKFRD